MGENLGDEFGICHSIAGGLGYGIIEVLVRANPFWRDKYRFGIVIEVDILCDVVCFGAIVRGGVCQCIIRFV